MAIRLSNVFVHRVFRNDFEQEGREGRCWLQVAARKSHETRAKVPQAISSNFVLRLMGALANGVSVALPRRRGMGQRPDVSVNSEVWLLIGFFLGTPLLIRRHLGASN
jgi:hypothetical protein